MGSRMRSTVSLNGLFTLGMEQPFLLQTEQGSSGFLPFLNLLILAIFYVSLGYLLAHLIFFCRSRFVQGAIRSQKRLHLLRERRMTLYGRLKCVGENHSDVPPHFILEGVTGQNAPAPFLEVSLSPTGYQKEMMSDYLGKRLMIAGRVSFNQRKGREEVVPELVMEVAS
jgi:hypothetical protein